MDRPLTDAVMDAISTDDPIAIDRLIEQGVDIADCFGGVTLLGWAASLRFPGQVDRLIKAGANVSDGGIDSLTPLATASASGAAEIVTLLLNAGADPDNAAADGLTPLMMAAKFGHISIVRQLLQQGANPLQRDVGGLTALSWAVSWADNPEIVSVLLAAGAKQDDPDEYGITPLDRAVGAGRADAAKVMRSHAGNSS
jgi:ankyrin repeat protein